MFRYYLSDALRSILRHRLYSVINIAGLAIGLACVILIALFVRDELSYDKWIPGTDDLYRIEVTLRVPGLPPIVSTGTPFRLATFMKEHIPEVLAVTHYSAQRITVSTGQRQFLEDVGEVDPNFFRVVKLPMLVGSPDHSLAHSESAIITQSVARKYFGKANPIGKTIRIAKAACGPENVSCSTEEPLRVTGVISDLPHNTQLTAQIFLPHTSVVDRIQEAGKQQWLNLSTSSYVKLKPGTDANKILSVLNRQLDLNVDLRAQAGITAPASKVIQVRLVPFVDVHLGTENQPGDKGGSWASLFGLGLIALLILAIASFNFMNLATARATLRSREIALRKCVGATRLQLVVPLLAESMVMAAVAWLFALSMVEMFLPAFSTFLGRPIALDYLGDWSFFGSLFAMALLTGLVSGLYPAYVLSGFQPGFVLRALVSGHAGTGRLRATLVVLQFGISVGLAIVALVVYSQITYARHIDMGFRYNGIVTIDAQRRLTLEQRAVFANVLRESGGVLGVAMSSFAPLSGDRNTGLVRLLGKSGEVAVDELAITPSFPEVYDMGLLSGRALSDRRPEDMFVRGTNESRNVLINATAAARFGFGDKAAVGQQLFFDGVKVRVVGVLKDARLDGALRPVHPTIFLFDKEKATILSVWVDPNKISTDDQPDAIAYIDQLWHQYAPTVAISRSSLSDSFNDLYAVDEKQGEMFSVLVAIAFLIACLGLFGLASFSAARRTKEIGIRKVFGARSRDIIWLLLWQFSIPVLVANIIAWPAAWFYLRLWLNGFADHISLNPLYFMFPSIAAMAVAWLTVFAHARQVAGASPIHALRYE